MNERQIAEQLAITYLSDFAYNPEKFLLWKGKRSYHFRMNLSYYYVEPAEKITKETLEKTNIFMREVLTSIFQGSSEVVLFSYIYTPKQLNRFFQKTQLHNEYFSFCAEEDVFLRKVKLTIKQPNTLYKLVKSLIYHDFPEWNTAPKLNNKTALLNPQKEILIHVYDDRGCDIFCRNEQDYHALAVLCKEKIESYTQDMAARGYQVIDSPYGVRFKRE